MQGIAPVNQLRKVDVLVVGAGPAGAVSARGLAAEGVKVLLVDAAKFPRWKVCGCCLNGAALRVLDEIGLAGIPTRLGAPRLTHLQISTRAHSARLALPAGVALSRDRFDEALINAAVQSGAETQTETAAEWIEEDIDGSVIALKAPNHTTRIRASVVIGADGLAAGFTRQVPGVRGVPFRHARIGAGTTIEYPATDYGQHTIQMAVGSGGYVGLVRVESGLLNVAAALDVAFVQQMRGLSNAATQIIAESGLPEIKALRKARWQGTPPLTRIYKPPPSGRLFLVGDAAEYVEPFTGEGMAWALAAGAGVVDHVIEALEGAGIAAQDAWLRKSQTMMGRRKRRCRRIARLLRHPLLTSFSIRLLKFCPLLARPYLRTLNFPRFGSDRSQVALPQS
jgi:flavin-dependent dehydrogenase